MKSVCESYLELDMKGQNRGIKGLVSGVEKLFHHLPFLGFPPRKLIPRISTRIFSSNFSRALFHDSARFRWKSIVTDAVLLDSEKSDDECSFVLPSQELFSYFRGTYRTVFYIFAPILFHIYLYIVSGIISRERRTLYERTIIFNEVKVKF